jgi:hypothetical protein
MYEIGHFFWAILPATLYPRSRTGCMVGRGNMGPRSSDRGMKGDLVSNILSKSNAFNEWCRSRNLVEGLRLQPSGRTGPQLE